MIFSNACKAALSASLLLLLPSCAEPTGDKVDLGPDYLQAIDRCKNKSKTITKDPTLKLNVTNNDIKKYTLKFENNCHYDFQATKAYTQTLDDFLMSGIDADPFTTFPSTGALVEKLTDENIAHSRVALATTYFGDIYKIDIMLFIGNSLISIETSTI